VVLFSLFTHFFEVPLGAIGWLIWWFGPKKEPADAEPERVADGGAMTRRERAATSPSLDPSG
jgi:hypothetical protein